MGLRFRKSIKLLPGVRLNFNTKSMSITAGFKGYHVTVNSKGGVSQTASIPGTGLSYTNRSSGRTPRRKLEPWEKQLKEEERERIRQLKADDREKVKERLKWLDDLQKEADKDKKEEQKLKTQYERSQRLTKRENEILDIIKGITYHISTTAEIKHSKNEFYLSFFYEFEPCWFCRFVLKGRKKIIIFPTEENKTQMYEFKKLDNIYDYSELIKWSAKRARTAYIRIINDDAKRTAMIKQRRKAQDKAYTTLKAEKYKEKIAASPKPGTQIVHDMLKTLLAK